MKKIITPLKSLITFLLILVLWFVVSKAGIFSSFVFPSPQKVFKAFLTMCRSGELIKHLLSSFLRVLAGFFISFVLAFTFAVITSLFSGIKPYLKGIFEFLRHSPPMSLIPLLILWFGIGEASKLIVIVLTAFFPIYMNAASGISDCDVKLVEVGKTLHMSATEIFFKIRLPYAVPQILVGMQIGLGYCWRAIVGAEMIAASRGLGYMILDSQAMSRTDKVIVGIILIGCIGILMDFLFSLLIKKFSLEQKSSTDFSKGTSL